MEVTKVNLKPLDSIGKAFELLVKQVFQKDMRRIINLLHGMEQKRHKDRVTRTTNSNL